MTFCTQGILMKKWIITNTRYCLCYYIHLTWHYQMLVFILIVAKLAIIMKNDTFYCVTYYFVFSDVSFDSSHWERVCHWQDVCAPLEYDCIHFAQVWSCQSGFILVGFVAVRSGSKSLGTSSVANRDDDTLPFLQLMGNPPTKGSFRDNLVGNAIFCHCS